MGDDAISVRLEGRPSDVHHWDCVLTADEIQRIANGTDPRLIRPEKHGVCCNPYSP